MKEIEVTILLRNNQLKERRLKLGMTQREISIAIGISQMTYGLYETMNPKAQLFNKRSWGHRIAGDWIDAIKKIAVFYDVDPSVLFPAAVVSAKTNKAIRKINEDDIPVLLSGTCDNVLPAETRQLDPEEQVAFRESIGWYTKTFMPRLTEQEQKVMRLRYGHDLNLTETANEIGKSRERVRQVQQKAFRKIRGVNHYKKINKDLSQDK